MQPQIVQFTTYLIDLDGVVYRGDELIPGAKEFVNWLNSNHKKYLFPTNNSFASQAQVVTKLARLGIATGKSHVLAAAQAAVIHIAHRFPGAHVYVVGEQPLSDLVLANGLQVVNTSSHKADVVLVGLDRAFNYKKLTEAVLAVRAGATFIAINRDSLLPLREASLLVVEQWQQQSKLGAVLHQKLLGNHSRCYFRKLCLCLVADQKRR